MHMNEINEIVSEGFKPVLMLSGGRTSALMLRLLLDRFPDYRTQFVTCFENTGKERDETLDFLHEIETRWDVPLVWLEYDRVPATKEIASLYPHQKSKKTVLDQAQNGETTHWFKVVSYQTAHRNLQPNSPFDKLLGWASVLPNVQVRLCSAQLKTRTAMRYLYSGGIINIAPFIGIRADEQHRAVEIIAAAPKRERPQFPLIKLEITERNVNDFWSNSDFDLQLKQHEGNCDLCFLKAYWKRVSIAREHPEFIGWWEGWEKTKGHLDVPAFRMGEPYSRIRQDAEHPELPMFGNDIGCSCMEGAFKSDGECDV